MKVLFPRNSGTSMTGVFLNTAGGITGGDRFDIDVHAQTGCQLILTTQAAERAYRAQPGETGQLTTRLSIDPGAQINWLPQETLLYDHCALDRALTIDMAEDSRFLMCEPVVFGRVAMKETVALGAFRDRVNLYRNGRLVFADRTQLDGPIANTLSGLATANGCVAMASVVLAAPDADRFLAPAQELMSETCGVSLIRPGLLNARLLAADCFDLRRTLQPLIQLLSGDQIPRTWMI